MKYVCFIAVKEELDIGTAYLLSLFLETKRDENKESIIIKLAGAVALLLVKYNEK